MYRYLVLSLAIPMQLAIGYHAEAQTSVLSKQAITYAMTQYGPSVAARISVDLRDVPLESAIQIIADRSKADITFSDKSLPVKRVTYHAKDVSVIEALKAVLENTSVSISRTASDGYKLEPGQWVGGGIVVGKVFHSSTKQPIVGASVSLGASGQVVKTAEDGTFRMNLPPGEHTIFIRAVGMVRASRKIVVSDKETITVSIELDPSASVLNEVVVTGTVVETERRAIPMPITVVTAEDIKKRGITQLDQLFRGEIPGVLAMDMGTTTYNDKLGANVAAQVYARGTASLTGQPNPLKTYIDGVELLDPAYLGTIDPSSIERIEIIAGPQAATIYGSGALGGVMQIFLKKGLGTRGSQITLGIKYGMMESNFSSSLTPSHDHSLSLVGGNGSGFSYSANASHRYTGQWQPALFSRSYGTSVGVTHSLSFFTVTGSVNATGSRRGAMAEGGILPSVRGTGYGTPYLFKLIEDGEMPTSTYNVLARMTSQRVLTSANQSMSFSVDFRPISIWQHHFTVGRTNLSLGRLPESPTFHQPSDTLYRTTRSSGARTTLDYNTTLRQRVGGISTALTLGMNGSWGEQLTIEGSLSSDAATSITASRVSVPIDDKSWGGFGSWQLGFLERVFLTLGIRGERNPNYGGERSVDWTPTMGMTYVAEVGDLTLKLLGSYGRATKAPPSGYRDEQRSISAIYDPSEFVSQLASPYLRPEYSRGPQGGVELYYGNRGSLTITHYQQKVTDMIQRVLIDSFWRKNKMTGEERGVPVWQYLNTATVRQKGWEAVGSVNVGLLSLKGTYSWVDSRILSLNDLSYYNIIAPGAFEGTPGQLFDLSPTHSGNMIIGYARGRFSGNLIVNWIGASLQNLGNSSVETWSGQRTKMYRVINRYPYPFDIEKPGYTKMNFVGTSRVSRHVNATLNIQNLGNSYVSDFGGLFPTLGRQTMIGLTVRFP